MIQYIKSLTSLRGIAALLVLLHHFFYYLLPGLGSTLSSYTKFFANGYLWVDFFFILSGFIMTHVYLNNFLSGVNSSSYKSYLFSRFARIYPLHIFTLFLFIALELTNTSSPFTGKHSSTAIFANIFLLQALDLRSPPLFGAQTYWNEPAWSISAEWIAYLVFPFLLFLLLKAKRITALAVYISGLISLFILIRLIYGHLDFVGIPSFVRCTVECIFGIITYKLYRSSYIKYFASDLLLLVSLIWIFIVMHYDRNDVVVLPAFCLLILSASINGNNGLISKTLNSRLLVYLGAISYSIYMIHWFIQELIKVFWWNTFKVNFGSGFNTYELLLTTILYILIVLLAASLAYRFIEVPMRNRLKVTAFARKYIYGDSKSLKSS